MITRFLQRATYSWRNLVGAAPDRSGLQDDEWKSRYLQSYLLLRVFIGVLGLLLPLMVWLGSALLPSGQWAIRGSLSAYYYSGMREEFTCTLWVTGFFLVAYKAFQKTFDDILTHVAGAAAILVAFFPTKRPSTSLPKTPLQQGVGETAAYAVHFTSAVIFVAALGVISYAFGSQEGQRQERLGRFSPRFWRRLHYSCAAAIGIAILFFGVHKLSVHWGASWGGIVDNHALWATEVVSVVAFGTSWLCKGSELWRLRHEAKESRRARPAASGDVAVNVDEGQV